MGCVKWLKKEPGVWGIGIYIFATLLFFQVYTASLTILMEEWIGIDQFLNRIRGNPMPLTLFTVVLATTIMPLTEEVVFRVAPLMCTLEFAAPPSLLAVCVLTTSLLFGLAHGGALNLLVQGMAGVLLCLIFIKCGGYWGHYRKAFTVTTITHGLHNGCVIVFALATGAQSI